MLLFLLIAGSAAAEPPRVAFDVGDERVKITIGGEPFAEYVFVDRQITRPYLAHVHAPGRIQVTRRHPPVEGEDLTDHASYHPGVWFALGDLNGADSWRLAEPIVQRKIVAAESGAGQGRLVVEQQYLKDGKPICDEVCERAITVTDEGWLLTWTSEFRPTGEEIVFGDQEEMGLGIRLATPLIVQRGGRLANSVGATNEKDVWGRTADWCEYSALLDGRRVGVLMMSDPRNFRPAWWHARDYGLLEANLFGQKSFTGGEASRVVIPMGESLRLRFAILFFNEDPAKAFDREEVYRAFAAAKPSELAK